MPCFSPTISAVLGDAVPVAPNSTFASADETSPALFVSNAPEAIGAGGGIHTWSFGAGPHNLCKVHLTTAQYKPSRVRVFFWHISRLAQPTYWAVLVGSNGTGGSISNLRRDVVNVRTTNIGQFGACFADAHLSGTINPIPGFGAPSLAGEVAVLSETVPEGFSATGTEFQFIGSILEFDVTPTLPELTIRSVVSLQSGQWGDFATGTVNAANNWPPDAENPQTHVRGYWLHSTANLLLPDYDCNPLLTGSNFKDYQFCANLSGESNYFSGTNSLAVDSRDNRAVYGANLVFDGNYHNGSPDTNGRFGAGIRARDTGARYYGAAHFALPESGGTVQIPPIPQIISGPMGTQYAERLCDLTPYNSQSVSDGIPVPPNTGKAFRVRVANAGGAGTPANLWLGRLKIEPNPPDDGGGTG